MLTKFPWLKELLSSCLSLLISHLVAEKWIFKFVVIVVHLYIYFSVLPVFWHHIFYSSLAWYISIQDSYQFSPGSYSPLWGLILRRARALVPAPQFPPCRPCCWACRSPFPAQDIPLSSKLGSCKVHFSFTCTGSPWALCEVRCNACHGSACFVLTQLLQTRI